MDGQPGNTFGYDNFEDLPPYPGVQLPGASATAGGDARDGGPGAELAAARRRWFHGSLAAGAVILAAGACLLGRGTAHRATTNNNPTATALSALSSATTPAP